MNLCFYIADRIHRKRQQAKKNHAGVKHADPADYWKWQYETSPSYFSKFFDLPDRLADAEVIDIGCGLGGRTCYLAGKGVRRIVGTDTNHAEIDSAIKLADQCCPPSVRSSVSFQKVNESEPHTSGTTFDVALLVDSLEHVRDPSAMLNLAHSLLKPGGVCYFSTWGWYHHQASHVGSIVPIPFATLLFSDRSILDAVRRIVDQPYYEPSMWDTNPPSRRWKDCQSLHDRPGEYLNKYTIAGFRESMKDCDFADWQMKVQGFSSSRHPILSWFNFLTGIPVIREVYHSALFGRLTRDKSDSSSGCVPTDGSPLRMAG